MMDSCTLKAMNNKNIYTSLYNIYTIRCSRIRRAKASPDDHQTPATALYEHYLQEKIYYSTSAL